MGTADKGRVSLPATCLGLASEKWGELYIRVESLQAHLAFTLKVRPRPKDNEQPEPLIYHPSHGPLSMDRDIIWSPCTPVVYYKQSKGPCFKPNPNKGVEGKGPR